MTQSRSILGKRWTFRLLDKKTYNSKKSRKNSLAMTYYHKRRVDFSPAGMDYETVLHELCHVYLYEFCIHSCNDINKSDLEEIYAEMFSKRGQEMLELGDKILTGFGGKI